MSIASRRPYASKTVMDGLESIAARTVPQSHDESFALFWISRMKKWRAGTVEASEPQEAEVCLPDRGEGGVHPAPPSPDGRYPD